MAHKNSFSLYRFFYGVGLHTTRMLRRFGRRYSRLTAPLRFRLRYFWKRRVVLPSHRFQRKIKTLFKRLWAGLRFVGRKALKNPLTVIPNLFRLFISMIRHYGEELATIGRILGPVAAAVVLFLTIQRWVQTEYLLTLSYRDVELGVIENAAVYDAGAVMAQDRVINADDSFTVDKVPVLQMSVQGEAEPMNEEQVCDAILSTVGDSIAEGTGLYVDGEFLGAMESRKELDKLLEDLKKGHYNPKNKNERAEFVQKVKKTDGLFPISTIKTAKEIKKILTAQTIVEKVYVVQAGDVLGTIAEKHDLTTAELRTLNPKYKNTDFIQIGDKLVVQRPQSFLQVKVVKTVKYSETIDYKTKTVYRDDKYTTYEKITTYGQEGKQNIVAEDTYIDGIKTGRKLLKKTVVKQPVTKVVEKGTKKVYNNYGDVIQQGDGVVTGNMTWPVPVCRNVYQGYHRGHLAIDISSGPIPVFNKPCLAADGGRVLYAGWYYGYGRYIKIQHANGLVTTYAHLNTINVVAGQNVSRGQMIGRVGNSGYSTGPHLHFEVIKNGVKVNPLNYVRP